MLSPIPLLANISFTLGPSGEMSAQRSQGYGEKYNPVWILPSFIKSFEMREFYEIWKSTINIISKTKEFIVIGYSFRPEDFNTQLLLMTLPHECNLTIVDSNFKDIDLKLEKFGFKNIKSHKSIEKYLTEYAI